MSDGKKNDPAMTTSVKQQTENLKRSTEELFNSFYEFAKDPNSKDGVIKNLDSFSSVCDSLCASIVSINK
jgi:hypothetical protein